MEDLLSRAMELVRWDNFEGFRDLVDREEGIAQLKFDYGRTLLHYLAEESGGSYNESGEGFAYTSFIQFLLKKGADVNARDNY